MQYRNSGRMTFQSMVNCSKAKERPAYYHNLKKLLKTLADVVSIERER